MADVHHTHSDGDTIWCAFCGGELGGYQSAQPCPDNPAPLRARVEELEAIILDIDAHATPLGHDENGFVTTGYLVSVGAIHRALGKLGRGGAPPCVAEARVAELEAEIVRMRAEWTRDLGYAE